MQYMHLLEITSAQDFRMNRNITPALLGYNFLVLLFSSIYKVQYSTYPGKITNLYSIFNITFKYHYISLDI